MNFWKQAKQEDIWAEVDTWLNRSYQDEENVGQKKVLAALEQLNQASAALDEIGAHSNISEFLTNLVVKFAEDINDFKVPVAERAPTPEQEIKNLKQHGWVFDGANVNDKPDMSELDVLREGLENDEALTKSDLDDLAKKHGVEMDDEDFEDE